ncbi:hypothetical protein [Flavobacterium capsici]|uniref:Uncharacterized protein n=1 Tax=Flavobacterium capsici TaxID=3075618 RepID=A0AA96F0R9_9FLAO|nr:MULTISPECIES: hypothetical protein [unclassified Flavobacterium]WNM17971.1 hypothetical protein RN608_08090 [Flavobacterium sp. PMR2A8]WNM22023.1 hypothetical protein RN605_01390 [Flavobacterium sp. PMTSA4]
MNHKEFFWHWFLMFLQLMHRNDGVRSKKYLKAIEKMNFHLDAYCPELGYFYAPPKFNGGLHEFTVYSRGDRTKLLKVQELVRAAPKINGLDYYWQVLPKYDYEDLCSGTDAPFEFEDFSIKGSDLMFTVVDYDDATGKIGIIIHVAGLAKDYDEDLYQERIYTVALQVLGEFAFYAHVFSFGLAPLEEGNDDLIYLYDLPFFMTTLELD